MHSSLAVGFPCLRICRIKLSEPVNNGLPLLGVIVIPRLQTVTLHEVGPSTKGLLVMVVGLSS